MVRQKRSLFQNSNEDRRKREDATLLSMHRVTAEYMEKMEKHSAFFCNQPIRSKSDDHDHDDEKCSNKTRILESGVGVVVPRFDPFEIELETTIGMGEFGVVLRVGRIELGGPDDGYDDDAENDHTNVRTIRSSLQNSCRTIHNADLLQYPSGNHHHNRLASLDSAAIHVIPPAISNSSRSINNADLEHVPHGILGGISKPPNGGTATAATSFWLSSNSNLAPLEFTNATGEEDDDDDSSQLNNHQNNVAINRTLRRALAEQCCWRQPNYPLGRSSTLPSCFSTSTRTHRRTKSGDDLSPPATTTDASQPKKGQSLLVIKQIRKDLYPNKRIEAAKDLAREAKFLARLQQLFFIEERRSSNRRHRYQNYRAFDNHPNLITLRGIVSSPGASDFGILLDRLHLTLAELTSSWGHRQHLMLEQIQSKAASKLRASSSSWWWWWTLLFGQQQNDTAMTNIGPAIDSCRSIDDSTSSVAALTETKPSAIEASPMEALVLLGERVLALFDVAEGMRHLHHHKILFRDLKTENVGGTIVPLVPSESYLGDDEDDDYLDDDGDDEDRSFAEQQRQQRRMQIFDFGLARECKDSDKVAASPYDDFYDTYKMTGLTGTMRIMAPEVIQCLPYGLPSDVYSYGICMWEVFTGKKCNFLSAAEICDAKQSVRPKLPMVLDVSTGSVGMPKELRSLMRRCWHESPTKRPSYDDISSLLKTLLVELHRRFTEERAATDNSDDFRLSTHSILSTRSLLQPETKNKRRFLSLSLRSCTFSGESSRSNPMQESSSSRLGNENDLDGGPSNSAAFWARLEAIHASGILDGL